MRFIFVDEAGTSAKEPVTVVVGLIADADNHVMNAEAQALEILGGIPPAFQDGFVFHATQVFGDRKYQKDWSLYDRLLLLKAMMSVPRLAGMAITVSAHWRNSVDYGASTPSSPISHWQRDHMQAFNMCLLVANRNIRRYAGPREVATVVAEDVPEMRRFLKVVPKMWRDMPMNVPSANLRQTAIDDDAGYKLQSGELRITRIRNSVHFVEKSEDPLVQVADACAYGFRRYFAGEKFGAEFVDAILGDHQEVAHFAAPMGCECFWPNPAA